MSEYRHRITGEVKTQGGWRKANPNISLPRVWTQATLDALELDPVLTGNAPVLADFQVVVRDGEIQDENGNWLQNLVARDMFADDAELGTKAEQEAAYQATLDAKLAANHRSNRDTKLAETDFYALSDVTMSAEMTTYRQALRDITSHANWPNLEEADWPTKPE